MTVELGPNPGDLIVRMVLGDAFTGFAIRDEGSGAVAWATAPVLEFGTGFTVEAELSEQDGDAAGSLATWTLTEEDVAAIPTRTKVRLAVDGITWYMGGTRCRN